VLYRLLAWAAVVVISTLAAQAFAAGVSGGFGQASTPPYTLTVEGHTTCWPIEAGVDAQCFDPP